VIVTNPADLNRRLALVEALIIELEHADAFVEDLISLHGLRNALAAELSGARRRLTRRVHGGSLKVIPANHSGESPDEDGHERRLFLPL